MKRLGLLLIWFVVSSCSHSESFIMGQCETRGVESEWCKKNRKEYTQQYTKDLPDYICDPGIPPRSKERVDIRMVNDAVEQKSVFTTWYTWSGYKKECHRTSTIDLEYKVIDKYKTNLFTSPTVFIDRSMEKETIDNIVRHYQIHKGKYGKKLPLGIEDTSEFYANKVLKKNYKKNSRWTSGPILKQDKNRKLTAFEKAPLAKPMTSAKKLEYMKNSDFMSFRNCGKCSGIRKLELCIRKYEQHYEKPITSTYNPNGCRQWN